MHTQGPWTTLALRERLSYDIAVSAGNDLPMADVLAGEIPFEQQEANAKLIAAAPDLLAELGAMVSAFDELSGLVAKGLFDAAEDYVTANQDEQSNAAHAAIAKATT